MQPSRFRFKANLEKAFEPLLAEWGGISKLARAVTVASNNEFVVYAAHVKSWMHAGNVPLHILPYVCRATDLEPEQLNAYLRDEFRAILDRETAEKPLLRLKYGVEEADRFGPRSDRSDYSTTRMILQEDETSKSKPDSFE